MMPDRGPTLVAPAGRTSDALSPTYVVVAPLADSFVGWSVYNCSSNPTLSQLASLRIGLRRYAKSSISPLTRIVPRGVV